MNYNARVLVFTLFIAFIGCEEKESSEVRLITANEMIEILQFEDVQLVDVRTPQEYNKQHIKNFQNIDFNSPTFEDDISKLDKSKPVILYCKSGNRSAKCAIKLKEAGFEKIFDLDGGISKWKYFEGIELVSSP